jgi:hypothetical protein
VAEFEFSYRSAAGEDLLYYDGPVIEVAISAPVPLLSYLRDNHFPAFPIIRGLAMIDTGASTSVLEEDVMIELDIPFLKTIWTDTIHGTAETRCFNASAGFPGLQLSDVPLRYVPGGNVRGTTNLGGDVIMLLGRDLLQGLAVTYDGPNSKVKIST